MGIGRLLALGILGAGVMGGAARAVPASEDSNSERWLHLCEGVECCVVHNVPLEKGTAPVLYGLYLPDPNDMAIERELFPFAMDWVFGGCCAVGEEEMVEVRYCPACRKAHAEYLAELRRRAKRELLDRIDACRDVKAWRGERGETFLHVAAEEGFPDIVKTLLGRGLAVDTPSEHGSTALHGAARSDCVEAAKVLVEAGANVNARDEDQCTPLHVAGPEVARVLVAHGADINAVDGENQTLLGQARMFGMEDEDFCAYLEDMGGYSEPNFITLVRQCPGGDNDTSRALLHRAAHAGEYNAVRQLIEKGTDINGVDESGCTSLHRAVTANWESKHWDISPNVRVVRLLVKSGIRINAQDRSGRTALYVAVQEACSSGGIDYMPVIKCLIDSGADVNLKDRSGAAPMDLTLGDLAISRLLIEGGADANAQRPFEDPLLFDAIRALDVDMAAFLIDAGADVKARNRAGQSALEYAMERHWKKVVQRMIDAHEDKEWIDKYRQECEDNTQRILKLLHTDKHGRND